MKRMRIEESFFKKEGKQGRFLKIKRTGGREEGREERKWGTEWGERERARVSEQQSHHQCHLYHLFLVTELLNCLP